MNEANTLLTALGITFGTSGAGILIATRGSWRRLRGSVLTQRYLSWLGLAVVYGVPLLCGVPGATALAALLAAQGAREAAPLLRLTGAYRIALIALCAAMPLFLLRGGDGMALGATLAVALGLALIRGRAEEADTAARLVFGALVIGWTLAHLAVLARVGIGWAVLALFGTAVSDVCAFTVGSLVKGPKLAPHLSPGKTWAGLAGNLLGAALALALIAPMLPPFQAFRGAVGAALVIAAIGIGGCVGDLTESLLKRAAGVKDAGAWLPGFGGLLDRVDSLLVVAPLLALLATLASHRS